jgi:Bacterial RNA polymerase, alpha chain C terminal domain
MAPHVTSFGPLAVPQVPTRVSVTVKHAAQALDVAPATIWVMIREGRLRTFTAGKRRLVLWSSILELPRSPPQDARRNDSVPALGARPGKRATRKVDLATKISELKLSARATNALTNNGVLTLEDLASKEETDLLRIQNLGRRSLSEIVALLKKHGLHLNTESAL